MKKQRNQYAPEEKVAILRRHLLEKEPISKLCDESGTPADGLLPLAKGILRERGCCLRAESASEPFRRAGADGSVAKFRQRDKMGGCQSQLDGKSEQLAEEFHLSDHIAHC